MASAILMGLGSAATGLTVGFGIDALTQPSTTESKSSSPLGDLPERMERVGMPTAYLPYWIAAWRISVVGSFLFFWLGLQMLPVALFVAFLLHRLLPLWLEMQLFNVRIQIRDQLVSAVRNLAGQVRAGMALEEAFTALALEAPDPFGWHLRRIVNQLEQGRSLSEALAELKARLEMEGASLLVLALLTAAEKGGKLADVLERTAGSLEELQRVQRKRESDTASGRLMVFILGAFPIAFLGLFMCLDPENTSKVFNTLPGQIVLAIVGALVYTSVRWAQAILDRVA
jgi:Flp pilus assembly protein TadB